MQKLIISSFLCLVSLAALAQPAQTVPAPVPGTSQNGRFVVDPNAITKVDQCAEFKQSADLYDKKAAEQNVYAEKYALISLNFKKMYYQCQQETQSIQQRYQGYRSNAIQQRQIDMQQIKR